MTEEQAQESDFLFYTSPEGALRLEVFFKDENVWLTQKKMAELFGVDVRTINDHLQNIYSSGELLEASTIRNFRIVQKEGERAVERELLFYNLDAIISVGYRVSSVRATQFRIWATSVLRDFMIKGFVLDEERLKNGTHFGKDYFQDLLEKIREIRASERLFYKKITDIYATSVDYDPHSSLSQTFFATVQNKLLFGVTGQTAGELLKSRAHADELHMGLQTWKSAPSGKILKTDVSVSKNYLSEEELKRLNLIVTMYLDYAELQVERQNLMKMTDWISKLDAFLQFNELEILKNPGKVSHEVAKALAEKEYEAFRVHQDRTFVSDFDKEVKKITETKNGQGT